MSLNKNSHEINAIYALYHKLLAVITDAVFILKVTSDLRFQYIEFNAACSKMLNCNIDDMREKYFEDVLPESLYTKFNAQCRKCIQLGETITVEEEIEFPIGLQYLYTTLVPIRNNENNIVKIIGVARNITEVKLREKTRRDSLEETLKALAHLIEEHDPYTANHEKKVAELAIKIGRKFTADTERLHWLYLAGIVHDIGKIRVPLEILTSPNKLLKPEMDLIRLHPEVGYNVLKHINFPYSIAEIVRQHHEFLDGSGYPRGLRKDAILLEAKIITVADIVSAMITQRPYHPALDIQVALDQIQSMRGKQLDERVVDACVELFKHDN